MKVRMGFVTNSSSYSSLVITVRSKKLVEILSKYELTGENIILDGDLFDFSDYEGGMPLDENVKSRKTFVNGLFDFLMDGQFDFEGDEDDFLDELNENKSEIIADITNVDYEYSDSQVGSEAYEMLDEDDLRASYPEKSIDDLSAIIEKSEYHFEIVKGVIKENSIDETEYEFD